MWRSSHFAVQHPVTSSELFVNCLLKRTLSRWVLSPYLYWNFSIATKGHISAIGRISNWGCSEFYCLQGLYHWIKTDLAILSWSWYCFNFLFTFFHSFVWIELFKYKTLPYFWNEGCLLLSVFERQVYTELDFLHFEWRK